MRKLNLTMLEELSKKDNLWRRIAYNICGNKMTADEVVNEMYLRFHRNPKEKVNDYYVALVLKSVYLNMLKKESPISIENLYYLDSKENSFEPDDEEYELILRSDNISWVQKEFLRELYDRSYREIAKIYNINYAYIYRKVKEAREELLKNK